MWHLKYETVVSGEDGFKLTITALPPPNTFPTNHYCCMHGKIIYATPRHTPSLHHHYCLFRRLRAWTMTRLEDDNVHLFLWTWQVCWNSCCDYINRLMRMRQQVAIEKQQERYDRAIVITVLIVHQPGPIIILDHWSNRYQGTGDHVLNKVQFPLAGLFDQSNCLLSMSTNQTPEDSVKTVSLVNWIWKSVIITLISIVDNLFRRQTTPKYIDWQKVGSFTSLQL